MRLVVVTILGLLAVGCSAEDDRDIKRLATQLAVELAKKNGPAFPIENRLHDPSARGLEVVNDVVQEIKRSKIFPDDQAFMKRIAFLETRNGETATSGSGGIWKVSKKAFEDTQNNGKKFHKRLQDKDDLIQATWGLKWNDLEYKDLNSPFISGLAARLYLSNDPNPLPEEKELHLQTRYWAENYHPADADTEARDTAIAALKREELGEVAETEEISKPETRKFKEILAGLAADIARRNGPATPLSVNSRVLDVAAKGEDVVSEVADKIENSQIFEDDHGLLRLIARLETESGERATHGTGGLWKLSERAFQETQNKGKHIHKRIQTKDDLIQAQWGVNWKDVTYRDLDKPFYSGLAARMFVSNDPNPIPSDVDGQLEYWKKHYNFGEHSDISTKALEAEKKCTDGAASSQDNKLLGELKRLLQSLKDKKEEHENRDVVEDHGSEKADKVKSIEYVLVKKGKDGEPIEAGLVTDQDEQKDLAKKEAEDNLQDNAIQEQAAELETALSKKESAPDMKELTEKFKKHLDAIRRTSFIRQALEKMIQANERENAPEKIDGIKLTEAKKREDTLDKIDGIKLTEAKKREDTLEKDDEELALKRIENDLEMSLVEKILERLENKSQRRNKRCV